MMAIFLCAKQNFVRKFGNTKIRTKDFLPVRSELQNKPKLSEVCVVFKKHTTRNGTERNEKLKYVLNYQEIFVRMETQGLEKVVFFVLLGGN